MYTYIFEKHAELFAATESFGLAVPIMHVGKP
jgi:hypothetical protein